MNHHSSSSNDNNKFCTSISIHALVHSFGTIVLFSILIFVNIQDSSEYSLPSKLKIGYHFALFLITANDNDDFSSLHMIINNYKNKNITVI